MTVQVAPELTWAHRTAMSHGTARLIGTLRNPSLELTISPWLTHPTKPHLTMKEWVMTLPGRKWDPDTKGWTITGLGPRPDQTMADAGIEVLGFGEGEFTGVSTLQDVYAPVSMLSSNGRTVLVRHRLAGFDECKKLIGAAAVWDKKRALFLMPVADVLQRGSVRPGIHFTQATLDRALAVHAKSTVVPGLESIAAKLGNAITASAVPDEIREAAGVVGHLPSWFGRKLFGYQIPGALAVAAGHNALFDAPGIGKTATFLAAAALRGSERTLIVCPPLVLTNWKRETILAGLAPEEDIAVFYAGRKEPSLDGKRVVIIGDSLLASRVETVERIRQWSPTYMGVDEAHRAKTIGSLRGEAVLNLVASVPELTCVPITGTPLVSGPHELVPLLEMSGHLNPVFGGPSAFLERYCRQDRFGGWHPRKENLAELQAKLREHVWVRRTKKDVLPDLPQATSSALPLDVDLKLYREAHKDVIESVTEWLELFVGQNGRLPSHEHVEAGEVVDEIEAYARESLRYVSQLRKAAGLTKIAPAVDLIRSHVEATTDTSSDGTRVFNRPLIVWTHHKDVTAAMAAAIPTDIGPSGVIQGGTSDKERNRLVDAYQAGEIAVLVCSITAAGVGITLTRGNDALFAEVSWVPAEITQAIDRQRRIGQENHISVQFLIALGTLDEHMQHVLEEKGVTITGVLGDDSNEVAVLEDAEDLETPMSIVSGLIDEAIKSYKRRNKS